jgi:hypothetical protein
MLNEWYGFCGKYYGEYIPPRVAQDGGVGGPSNGAGVENPKNSKSFLGGKVTGPLTGGASEQDDTDTKQNNSFGDKTTKLMDPNISKKITSDAKQTDNATSDVEESTSGSSAKNGGNSADQSIGQSQKNEKSIK